MDHLKKGDNDLGLPDPYTDTTTYVKVSKMEKLGVWGTEVELGAIATYICEYEVYVYFTTNEKNPGHPHLEMMKKLKQQI